MNFSTSTNGRNFKTAAKGEFSNIVNSRLEQTVNFETVKARFIKLKGVQVNAYSSAEEVEGFRTSFPEIGIITEK